MDKTRNEMNGNQHILLSYLESLVPKDDVLMGIAEFQSKLSEHSVPKEVYIALGMLINAEITNVLHELTRPF
jgi:recombinational DNA repair protein RecR